MSDLLPWLLLVLWLVAIGLRVHPTTRRWAPRGIAGPSSRPSGPVHPDRAPVIPPARAPVDPAVDHRSVAAPLGALSADDAAGPHRAGYR